jgi:hypothetical protein
VFANVKRRQKRKMQFRENAECFYCNEVYKLEDHTTCPRCASSTHTKEITIINIEEKEMDEKQELCKYCGDTVDDCIDAEECNEGVGRQRPDDDDMYEAYKEQKADEYFDSQE